MISSKEIFLQNFISEFCIVDNKKRRTKNCTAKRITNIFNKISKNRFKSNVRFTENDIIKSFKNSGYQVLKTFSHEHSFDFDKLRNGSVLGSDNEFIGLKSECISVLNSAGSYFEHTNKDNWKPESILRTKDQIRKLNEFWRENKELL